MGGATPPIFLRESPGDEDDFVLAHSKQPFRFCASIATKEVISMTDEDKCLTLFTKLIEDDLSL